ncbi:hypothetical protein cyc_00417 [Cyclospora cayetanensis]|uniref:Transmembrane protein n=1 Tax=Cyclospora cayetanensis TaxID=88456 RepID=A0A1D3D3F5_9EIME|nr:hypothetical protein cyc_00417 [Cyclospora cayetanensis]
MATRTSVAFAVAVSLQQRAPSKALQQQGPPDHCHAGPLSRLMLLSLLLVLGLFTCVVPAAGRVAFLSPYGGALLARSSASVDATFAPWGPPVGRVVGQLLYKGSNCSADAPEVLSFPSLDFRPQLLRLSLQRALGWLTQQLPSTWLARRLEPAEESLLSGARNAQPSDPALFSGGIALAGEPTRGDSWRWAFSHTYARRKASLSYILPLSFALWNEELRDWSQGLSPGESLKSSPRSDSASGKNASPEKKQPQHQPSALAGTGEEPAEATEATWAAHLRGAEGALLLNGLRRVPLSRKRIWLFDSCTEEELLGLIKAANASGASALLLTDTTFKDYSLPLLGNVFAPKPLMPVASLPDSPLLQQMKRQAAAGAAADEPLFVLVDSAIPEEADCAAQWLALLASLVALPLWGALAFLWHAECRRDNGRDSTPLHWLLMLPPLLKAATTAVQVAYYLQCPTWNAPAVEYLVMAVMSLETLFQTFFFASLLLISKGYLLTRETFGRGESFTTTLLISTVYVVSSTSQVEPSEGLPARLCLYIATLCVVLPSCSRSIRQVRLRLEYVQGAGLPEFVDALRLKEWMFRVHYFSCLLFFSLSAACTLFFLVVLDRPDLETVTAMLLEFLFWTALAITFRPRRGIAYFTLLQPSVPVPLAKFSHRRSSRALYALCLCQSSEPHSILPMYAATPLLPNGRATFGGDVGASAEQEDPFAGDRPILILNPSASETLESPFRGLALATLVSQQPTNDGASVTKGSTGQNEQASQGDGANATTLTTTQDIASRTAELLRSQVVTGAAPAVLALVRPAAVANRAKAKALAPAAVTTRVLQQRALWQQQLLLINVCIRCTQPSYEETNDSSSPAGRQGGGL